jgi:hypothetical protein
VFPRMENSNTRTGDRAFLSQLRNTFICEAHLKALFQLVFREKFYLNHNNQEVEKCYLATINQDIRNSPIAFPFPYTIGAAKKRTENTTGIPLIGRSDANLEAISENDSFDLWRMQTTRDIIVEAYTKYFQDNRYLQSLVGRSEMKNDELKDIIDKLVTLHGRLDESSGNLYFDTTEYDNKFTQTLKRFLDNNPYNLGLPLKYKELQNAVILAQKNEDVSSAVAIPFPALPVMYQHLFSLFEFSTLQDENDIKTYENQYNLKYVKDTPEVPANALLTNYQVLTSANNVDRVSFADDQPMTADQINQRRCLEVDRIGLGSPSQRMRTDLNCKRATTTENRNLPIVVAPPNLVLNLCTLSCEFFNYSLDRPICLASEEDDGHYDASPLIVQGVRFLNPRTGNTFLEQWTTAGVNKSIINSRISLTSYGNYQYSLEENVNKSQALYANELTKKMLLGNPNLLNRM